MKKKTKTAFIVLGAFVSLAFLLVILFIVLYASARLTMLSQNPLSSELAGSLWTSEDGNVRIEVRLSDYYRPGQLLLDGETVDFEITGDMYSWDLYLYYPNGSSNEYFERWTWSYCNEDKFIATVEESTYFTVGEQIVFYRTDMGLYS